MLKFLKKQANMAQTENGAATHASTYSDCLDLFGTIGALRRQPEGDILSRFIRAYGEDPDLAMKILFFARDIRGGLGERRVFRVILRWMAQYEPGPGRKNLPHIAEYGRFDDLLCLLDTPCEADALALIKAQLEADCSALSQEDGQISLLAKWLPSSSPFPPALSWWRSRAAICWISCATAAALMSAPIPTSKRSLSCS